jgi:hypothetical protein
MDSERSVRQPLAALAIECERISHVRWEWRDREFLGLLHVAGLIATLAGAVGSLVLMLRAGSHSPRILLTLFTIWVLSPFAALISADMVSRPWPVPARVTLYSLMVVLSCGSLAVYGNGSLRPPKAHNAFVFLVVPLGAWLLMAIVFPSAFLIGRRSSGGGRP